MNMQNPLLVTVRVDSILDADVDIVKEFIAGMQHPIITKTASSTYLQYKIHSAPLKNAGFRSAVYATSKIIDAKKRKQRQEAAT